MTRAACFLGLIALAVLFPLVVDLTGGTAILFTFVGMPALGVALLLHLLDRWRAGAFRFDEGKGVGRSRS